MKYDKVTRLLHLLIAAGITLQLFVSLTMVTPRPGRAENFAFEIHEVLGVALLAVLVVHWLWSISRFYAGDFGMLIPWFSRRRRAALVEDAGSMARELMRLRMPSAHAPRPVPAAVEGLGLLAGTWLALSGTIWLLGSAPDGGVGPVLHLVKETHELAGNLMWAYLIGHVAMAVLHQLAGEATLLAMFSFRRRKDVDPLNR